MRNTLYFCRRTFLNIVQTPRLKKKSSSVTPNSVNSDSHKLVSDAQLKHLHVLFLGISANLPPLQNPLTTRQSSGSSASQKAHTTKKLISFLISLAPWTDSWVRHQESQCHKVTDHSSLDLLVLNHYRKIRPKNLQDPITAFPQYSVNPFL